jgi:acyl-CoA thioester hydrolase
VNRWPVTIELPVQWGDMDSFQHVNNVTYLRWFESARIAYFEKAGILAGMPDVGPIQARQEIDYRLPLTYPDSVRVAATVTKLGNTSFTMALRVRSRNNDRAIAAEGVATIVMFDYRAGHKTPISPQLREAIEALEASAPEPGQADEPWRS